jgi:hypothetical protein
MNWKGMNMVAFVQMEWVEVWKTAVRRASVLADIQNEQLQNTNQKHDLFNLNQCIVKISNGSKISTEI